MPTPKVLILTGDAGESLEVLYPYQRLKEEGYEVEIAGPSKKKLHFVVHDFEPEVKAAGATYVDSDAVIDGEMVSARAWPDHPAWMREFIRMLRKKAPVQEKEAAAVR